MYESYYGLNGNPFRLAPDPRFFYPSSGHKRGLAYLRYGLQQAQGFVAVTGNPGTGKTMLLQTLLSELSASSTIVATLSSTNLSADDVLHAVAEAFGVQPTGTNKAAYLSALERFFNATVQNGKRVLLIVDEAQNLPPRSLEELRMLSNFHQGNKALLQIILLGQQQLRQILAAPDMEQLSQRIIAACHLQPISADETRAYLAHRLRLVGWRGTPSISGEALSLIYRCSKGLPRLINVLCERVFLAAYLDERQVLDATVVRSVIEELSHEVGSGWDFSRLDALSVAESELAPLPDPTSEADSANLGEDRNKVVTESHQTNTQSQDDGNNAVDAMVLEEAQNLAVPEADITVEIARESAELERHDGSCVTQPAPEPMPTSHEVQEIKLSPAADIVENASANDAVAEETPPAKVVTISLKRMELPEAETSSEFVVALPASDTSEKLVKSKAVTLRKSQRRGMGQWLAMGAFSAVAAGIGVWWLQAQPRFPELAMMSHSEEAPAVTETPVTAADASATTTPTDESSLPAAPDATQIESSPAASTAAESTVTATTTMDAEPPLEKSVAKSDARKESKSAVTSTKLDTKAPPATPAPKPPAAVAVKKVESISSKPVSSAPSVVKQAEPAVAPTVEKSAPAADQHVAVAGTKSDTSIVRAKENVSSALEVPPEVVAKAAVSLPPVTDAVLAKTKASEPKTVGPTPEGNQKTTNTAKTHDLALAELAIKLEEFYNNGSLQSFVGLFANDAWADGSQGQKRIARDYRELFESTEMREMKISDLRWQEADGKISGVGNFEANIWRRGEDSPRVSKGKINVVVVDQGGRILIERLAHQSR